jgi:hypothetical protein
MRRLFALSLLISSLACAGAAGLTAPAAFAAAATSTGAASTTTPAASTAPVASTTPAIPQPSLNLSNAEQSAAGVSTPQQTVPVTTTTSSGGLSGLDALIIAIVAVLVLVGIAFGVWLDARRSAARVGHGHTDDSLYGERAHSGSKAPHKPRKLKPAERKRRKRGRAR